jgi:hypothetical protein
MAHKKVYIGSVGPYVYDDTEAIDDPDGDLGGYDFCAISTTGQLLVEEEPTDALHVLRLEDINLIVYPIGLILLTGINSNPSTLGIPGTWTVYN